MVSVTASPFPAKPAGLACRDRLHRSCDSPSVDELVAAIEHTSRVQHLPNPMHRAARPSHDRSVRYVSVDSYRRWDSVGLSWTDGHSGPAGPHRRSCWSEGIWAGGGGYWIRTSVAFATVLQTAPFGRSGNPPRPAAPGAAAEARIAVTRGRLATRVRSNVCNPAAVIMAGIPLGGTRGPVL